MRGHLPLIALRHRGQRPAVAFFTVDSPDPAARYWHEHDHSACIEIAPDDRIGLLDLRFIVGMVACIQGDGRDRCMALHKACQAAGATQVLTHVMAPTDKPRLVLQHVDNTTTFEAAS